jgi:hypothetical protein
MRFPTVALAAVLGLTAACASVDPAAEPERWPAETVRAHGLAFTVLDGRWPGYPPDLGRYFRPLEAVVANEGTAVVPVRVEDFALVDAAAREVRAVTPAEATTSLFGTYGRRRSAVTPDGQPVAPARTYFSFSGRFGYPYYYGRYYPYYYPYAGPPYYAAPRAPTYEEATGDLLRYALADGDLTPGRAVRGFLYFPADSGDTRGLRVRWSPPGVAEPLVAPVVD